jgi:cell wall assembly regulator SMI1
MEFIKTAWQRISAWYDANTPEGTLVLASGASEAKLVEFEKEIGFSLPDDLRASFALHNGTSNGGYLLHHGELLSLKQVLSLHKTYAQWQVEENWGLGPDYQTEDISGPIKPTWWSASRVPLTDNNGDAVMADFDPATEGHVGQVIEFDHEVGPRRVFSPSFGQWLNDLAEGLENGEYIYYKDERTVAPPGIW